MCPLYACLNTELRNTNSIGFIRLPSFHCRAELTAGVVRCPVTLNLLRVPTPPPATFSIEHRWETVRCRRGMAGDCCGRLGVGLALLTRSPPHGVHRTGVHRTESTARVHRTPDTEPTTRESTTHLTWTPPTKWPTREPPQRTRSRGPQVRLLKTHPSASPPEISRGRPYAASPSVRRRAPRTLRDQEERAHRRHPFTEHVDHTPQCPDPRLRRAVGELAGGGAVTTGAG